MAVRRRKLLKHSQRQIAEHHGQAIYAYTLTDALGFTVSILNYGAIIQQILVPDRRGHLANVVLNHSQFDPANPGYLGAIIGRCAGRIANSSFTLAGRDYRLEANHGAHLLHGGCASLDKVVWQVSPLANGLRLTHFSPDGSGGFPGDVHFSVDYLISQPWQLSLIMRAQVTMPTLINLTNHSYFDLSGIANCQQHLTIASDYIASLTPDLIPDGQLLNVRDTPFDFHKPRLISPGLSDSHPQIRLAAGYDHPFLLQKNVAPAIELSDPESGRFLRVHTSEPVCVVYSGNHLPTPGMAICLETQRMPNAINWPEYREQVMVSPTTPYLNQTIWQFGVNYD